MDFLLGKNWNESADSARYYDFRLYISDHDKRKSCFQFQDLVCVSSTSLAANPVFKALLLFVKEASTAELYVFFSWCTTLPPAKKCIKTRRMTQNLPTVLLPWKARMFVNHPNTSNAADCVLLHSLRKPRWGEHFTPPLCKSFRKLGRLARSLRRCCRWVDWLAVRSISSPPGRRRRGRGKGRKGRKSLKRARKATSSSSLGMSSAFGWEIWLTRPNWHNI